MIRVVLADDESLVRMGLRVLIDREDDLAVAGEAASGPEALRVVRETRPDVLLLDVRMPGMDGLATLRAITADPELAALRVVIVTTFEIDSYIFAALQAGAAGFVLKDTAPADLVRAIRVAAAGEALLSPSVTRRVVSMFSQPGGAVTGIDTLTGREREIVAWVTTGHTNEQIARELRLSPATVRTHAGRAMVKLNARTRAQLVVIGVRAGLTVDR
ncbi:response regulator transcription factor [Actinoplanes sp. N902-109]|uniref:response regulator n=1 Tax=Actinoplanes sp. (strain N902-109) TaxID=649831 RepID=UPI000329633A|nr:response regulator transcription factor [Actinoplanes sp. N902-109]AGL17577.1 two component transcriptional regulator, LuxR family [Actinoplanes sp. N902-109]